MNDFKDYLENTFTYHSLKERQPEKYQKIREEAKKFAKLILEICPASRERSIALTRLEEVTMWSNASIARNE